MAMTLEILFVHPFSYRATLPEDHITEIRKQKLVLISDFDFSFVLC
jgi:hypothetical protein